METQNLIFEFIGLQRGNKFEQATMNDYKVNVFRKDDAPMLHAIRFVLRVDPDEIFFVDGNHRAILQNGKLHLRIIVLRIHAGFVRAYGINSDRAQASSDFVRQILIQVQFDLQAAPPTLRLNTRRKPVHCLE